MNVLKPGKKQSATFNDGSESTNPFNPNENPENNNNGNLE